MDVDALHYVVHCVACIHLINACLIVAFVCLSRVFRALYELLVVLSCIDLVVVI